MSNRVIYAKEVAIGDVMLVDACGDPEYRKVTLAEYLRPAFVSDDPTSVFCEHPDFVRFRYADGTASFCPAESGVIVQRAEDVQ